MSFHEILTKISTDSTVLEDTGLSVIAIRFTEPTSITLRSFKKGPEKMAEDLKLITPELFQSYMDKLLMQCKVPSVSNADIYNAIYEGTFLMCAVLSQLGYKEGIKMFEEICMTPKPDKPKKLVTFLN